MSEPGPRPEVTEQLLDKLVDGELVGPERRQLLQALDAQPDGWRRCALAFLEAQCWRQVLGEKEQIFAESPTTPDKVVPSLAAGPRGRAGWLALAACLALAFVGGGLLRGGWPSTAALHPALDAFAFKPSRTNAVSSNAALNDSPRAAASLPSRSENALSPDAVTLVVDGPPSAGARQLHVPLVENGRWDGLSDWDGRWAIPAPVLDELQRGGHRLERRRRYAPFDLQDGRQMIVPVDDLQIMPVESRVY